MSDGREALGVEGPGVAVRIGCGKGRGVTFACGPGAGTSVGRDSLGGVFPWSRIDLASIIGGSRGGTLSRGEVKLLSKCDDCGCGSPWQEQNASTTAARMNWPPIVLVFRIVRCVMLSPFVLVALLSVPKRRASVYLNEFHNRSDHEAGRVEVVGGKGEASLMDRCRGSNRGSIPAARSTTGGFT